MMFVFWFFTILSLNKLRSLIISWNLAKFPFKTKRKLNEVFKVEPITSDSFPGKFSDLLGNKVQLYYKGSFTPASDF